MPSKHLAISRCILNAHPSLTFALFLPLICSPFLASPVTWWASIPQPSVSLQQSCMFQHKFTQGIGPPNSIYSMRFFPFPKYSHLSPLISHFPFLWIFYFVTCCYLKCLWQLCQCIESNSLGIFSNKKFFQMLPSFLSLFWVNNDCGIRWRWFWCK